jgi:hypothetical protein
MIISSALAQLFQSLSLAGVVTLLVNIIAPYLERYAPMAAPNASTHDATLRAVNLALNIGLAFGAAALLNQLTSGQAVLAVIGFGIAQATGSHLLYTSGNRPPAPVSTPVNISVDGKQVATALVNSLPVVKRAPVTPPPAASPSLVSLIAPTAQAVSDAVNAAIAAQTS